MFVILYKCKELIRLGQMKELVSLKTLEIPIHHLLSLFVQEVKVRKVIQLLFRLVESIVAE